MPTTLSAVRRHALEPRPTQPTWHAHAVVPRAARVGARSPRREAPHMLGVLIACWRVAQACVVKGEAGTESVSVTPAAGPMSGGQVVTVRGTGLL